MAICRSVGSFVVFVSIRWGDVVSRSQFRGHGIPVFCFYSIGCADLLLANAVLCLNIDVKCEYMLRLCYVL